MAHNLNFNKQSNEFSFFTVKEKAWHGLGQLLDFFPTSKEAIQYAHLGYTVEKRKLFTYDNENQNADEDTEIKIPEVEINSHFATIRTDTDQVLGIVGKDYKIVQNGEAFSFFDSIVGGEGIQYETAGALGKGERIFITAKLPDYIKVGNDDLIEQYIFLTTSHDGYGSITAAFTPVRVVCQNTLNAALGNHSNCIKIRHTANAKERLEQAHKVMGISYRLSEQLEEIFNEWTKVRMTDAELKKLIQMSLVNNKEALKNLEAGREDELSTYYKNVTENAYEYAMSSPTQQLETTKGTVFGAYNSVTGYFQNVRKYKNEEAKLKSLMFGGTGQTQGQIAFNLCAEFAKKDFDGLLLN